MYLKQLEVAGFKSFMGRTRLAFEPGMTAIVGPNGCGKSNISDAMRWVLGEQSAKALRGSKMEDVIFNGTDNRKPQGMAEVSVTFADCEGTLETEFNEVTITRRVFRSGEGQYLINKTPCRLKDIQRLLMDTGVGTRSYSVLEQGRIDQILSSRPEDRRTVFEEASGITKFKADKKEALRKLDQTEANLLRLADVIREVKRQIGSLQRQAGKARRYKELHAELQHLDLHVTRHRVAAMDRDLAEMDAELAALAVKLETAQREIAEAEHENAALRQTQMDTEREIGAVVEAGVQVRSRLEHTREIITMNRQRRAEYEALTQRDTAEIESGRRRLDEQTARLESLGMETSQAENDETAARASLETCQKEFDAHRARIDAIRHAIQALREEAVGIESTSTRLQNELVELETRERAEVLRRERLTAEQAQLRRAADAQQAREASMEQELETLRTEAAARHEAVATAEAEATRLQAQRAELQQRGSELRSQAAACRARIELLENDEDAREEFPAGARLLLDAGNPLDLDPGTLIGTLASLVDTDPAWRPCVETALRAWLDAVVVTSPGAARRVLQDLAGRQAGAARLLVAPDAAPAAPAPDGDRLVDKVRCPPGVRAVLERLIGHVRVAADLAAIPDPLPPDAAWVTPGGALVAGTGAAEYWCSERAGANPFSRRYSMDEARREADRTAAGLAECQSHLAAVDNALRACRERLQAGAQAVRDAERRLAQKEGERQVVASEAREAGKRLETVTWELESLQKQDNGAHENRRRIQEQLTETRSRREQTSSALQDQTGVLHTLEDEAAGHQLRLTDARVRHAGLNQRLEHLRTQQRDLDARIRDLRQAVDGRSHGLETYRAGIERLSTAIAEAEASLGGLEEDVRQHQERADSLRRNQQKQTEELREMEAALARRRDEAETLRKAASRLELRRSETRMQRQNAMDRVTADYRMTAEDVMSEPDEESSEPVPVMEEAEIRVAELRTKLEAMGPVNLIAIEEYQELEERFQFLTEQETDLVNAKQQLLDMIRNINRTTSEMFRSTFEQVNANFDTMYKKLFRGGSAKLVLVDEEDILESGIEIIARPPGKRLQNVSLLSGGERTMTAVALLFAIYMIKPSPFCILDELDAALDDSNIGRFVSVLQEFLHQSQFVVITHNRQTIAAASVVYGVTMPEKGVSNIMSMKFSEAAKHEDWVKPSTGAPAAAEPAS